MASRRGFPVFGVLIALVLLGFFLIVAASLFPQAYTQPNRTGVFVFPFGFAVVSGSAGWLAEALILAFVAIFFVFVIFFTVQGFRWTSSAGTYVPYDRAIEELRLRYARGEITKEQFEQMLRELREQRYS